MKKNVLILSSAVWGLAMFTFSLYEFWTHLTLPLVIVLLALCLFFGGLWGAAMYLFFSLLNRYAGRGIKASGATVIYTRNRLLKYSTLLLSMLPVIGGAFVWPEYFWPSVVASVGPILVMLPFAYKRQTMLGLGFRFVAGILLGTAMAIGVFLFGHSVVHVPTDETILLCSLFALSWGGAQILSILQYKVSVQSR